MSGIYAAIVTADDGGIRRDNARMISRSMLRGADAKPRTALVQDGNVEMNSKLLIYVDNNREPGKRLAAEYAIIGASVSQSSPMAHLVLPERSPEGRYICVWDGIITGGHLPSLLDKHGFWIVSQLGGNFSALILDTTVPDRIWFVNRAKPLYALYDQLGRCIRVASQRQYFDGMYHPLRNPSPLELGPFDHGWVNVLGQKDIAPLRQEPHEGTVMLSGGGLDTLVAAHSLRVKPVTLLYVDYGARAAQREWEATQHIAKVVGGNWVGLDAMPLRLGMRGALTGSRAVEKNPVAGVASEWLPGRNSLLMAIAMSYAESIGYGRIATGINMQAASAYPDNEEEWANKWQSLVPYSVSTSTISPRILSPLAGMNKTDIVKWGLILGIDTLSFAMSWSCYEGGEKHCGQCSSCRARRAAFIEAEVEDGTEYAN